MATLLLTSNAAGARPSECPNLRAWLRRDWAILFSHPDDFVRCDLEMDRWLAVVQRAFAGSRIRPLALASPTLGPQDGWVAQVSGDSLIRLLETPGSSSSVDLQAHALQHDIASLGGRRFVMIIDEALCPRRTFTYKGLADVPSPLEFLGWADAERARHSERRPSAAAHPAHVSMTRRHKHRSSGLACSRVTPSAAG